MTTKRPKRLKTLVSAGSFVHVDGDVTPDFAAKRAASLARLAETHRITGLFTADLLQVDPEGSSRTTGLQDPLIALAGLAQVTSNIGLIATVSTTYLHPFNLARQIGTLDHASGGRAAWNAVTSSVGEENFGSSDIPTPEERYERGQEFIEVVNALFDSNEKSVVRRNRDGGVLVDHRRFRRIDYNGKHFQVAGPFNIPPTPQGRPVQFQAGQSRNGVTLGARLSEVVYTSQPTLEDAITFATDIRNQAKAFGRADNLPLIQNALHAVIGESEADVARRVREKHEKIDYVRGRHQLANMLGGDLDLSDLPLDKPLPESLIPSTDETGRRRHGRIAIFRRYALSGLSLRELIVQSYETGHWAPAGTPEQLADALEERFRAGVLDVVYLRALGNPDQDDLLLNGLLPELRRRDLIDDDYIEGGFRANLGLPPLSIEFADDIEAPRLAAQG